MAAPEFDLLVIGGGPAGLSAARGYRRAGGSGSVAIVTDEQRMPYSRPPLTKELLRGEIEEEELPLEPEGWLEEQAVSLISGRAVALDHEARRVTLSGGRELGYRCCVLGTGAEPKRLPIPGSDHPAVLVVRTLEQVRELRRRLAGHAKVIVIGSGFIGCEIAASLRHHGLSVTLFSADHVPNETRLGVAAGAQLQRWLEEYGVKLSLGVEVDAIERIGDHLRVSAGTAAEVGAVVVMAVGVAPRSELLVPSGTNLADDGAIPVDTGMRTALDGVLAAGDVCKAHNLAAGRSLRVEHWGDALAQGEIAGATAAGRDAGWAEVPGFWSTIGRHTLKYAAWGDGYETSSFEARLGGGEAEGNGGNGEGWVVWYMREGTVVGVLTHQADDQYERGRALIAQGAAAWR